MSISEKIRAQIISSFRAELSEHIQTMTDGLLALEQNRIPVAEHDERMATIFRAAHSLKGAARAVGVTAVEQLAHSLEDVLGGLQKNTLTISPEMFTACYRAIDAIQLVETAYEAGETTPPMESLMALAGLEPFRHPQKAAGASSVPAVTEPAKSAKKETKTDAPRSRTSKKGLDNLRDLLADSREDELGDASVVEQPVESAQPPEDGSVSLASASAGMAAAQETVRVSVDKLDALMEQLNELLVAKIRAEQHLTQMRQAQLDVDRWQKDWLKVRGSYGRLSRYRGHDDNQGLVQAHQRKEFDRLLAYVQSSQERLKALSSLLTSLAREYHSDTMQMSLVINRLEEEIIRTRMLPFASITATFGRMVRDLALAAGKDINFEMTGGEVEMDKRVLEQIKDPVIHLLRNAVDHGIEFPARRVAAGKPAQGKIILAVEQFGKDVSISVRDDGAGLDLHAIREAAVRRKVKDAVLLGDNDLIELIYAPSFSTSAIITDVSGRGIGLDVVRRNVESLQGRVHLESKLAQGTTFTLSLPVSLTTSRGLLVDVAGQVYVIPVQSVERILYVGQDEIQSVSGRPTIRYQDHTVILAYLADVLGMPRVAEIRPDQRLSVVLLSSAERRMAFVVDALIGEQEVVVKSLGKQIARVAGIAGASLMGGGEVLLILNSSDLIKLAWREDFRPNIQPADLSKGKLPDAQVRHTILVVDDSITTRTLEKNILESSGYIVRLALDGEEAFNLLMTRELPDLVISDIQMPRMNGFDLTARIKKEARTSKLPVILVSSLDSAGDKARGIEVGADAYIVKQSFDQTNLLETINQLI